MQFGGRRFILRILDALMQLGGVGGGIWQCNCEIALVGVAEPSRSFAFIMPVLYEFDEESAGTPLMNDFHHYIFRCAHRLCTYGVSKYGRQNRTASGHSIYTA